MLEIYTIYTLTLLRIIYLSLPEKDRNFSPHIDSHIEKDIFIYLMNCLYFVFKIGNVLYQKVFCRYLLIPQCTCCTIA